MNSDGVLVDSISEVRDEQSGIMTTFQLEKWVKVYNVCWDINYGIESRFMEIVIFMLQMLNASYLCDVHKEKPRAR